MTTPHTASEMPALGLPCASGIVHECHYSECSHGSGPGERDSMCPICYDDFDSSECTTTHTLCRRTFHTKCVDWVASQLFNQNAANDNDPDSEIFYQTNIDRASEPAASDVESKWLLCPICRQGIVVTGHARDELLTGTFPYSRFLRDISVDEILEMVRNGATCSFERRSTLVCRPEWLEDGEFRRFRDRWFTYGSNGRYPSYTLPPVASRGPGVDIFQGASITQAGALRIDQANHRYKIVLLTPKQVYEYVTALYRNGWCPTAGTFVKRLNLSEVAGWHLYDIVQHAARQQILNIDTFELEYLFPRMMRGSNQSRRTMHLSIIADHPTDTISSGPADQPLHINFTTGRWTDAWYFPLPADEFGINDQFGYPTTHRPFLGERFDPDFEDVRMIEIPRPHGANRPRITTHGASSRYLVMLEMYYNDYMTITAPQMRDNHGYEVDLEPLR